jgi:hypothetical protein
MSEHTSRKPSLMAQKFIEAYKAGAEIEEQVIEPRPVEPNWYFFYGTLSSAEAVARVLNLEELPQVMKAKVRYWCIRYWGQYRVLCPGSDGVCGIVCYVPTTKAVLRLREYETDAYYDAGTYAFLENGERLFVRTFLWNRSSTELQDEPDPVY